ncbi:MAG: MarR family transcriptional regulator [Asticcacaulis sp.]
MSSDPAALTSHIGFHLRMVSNHVSQSFAAKLMAQKVTVAEWVMLRALFDQPPLPPSLLADRLGLTRGAISKLAGRLIAKELIARSANPNDARAQTLQLTSEGYALVPVLASLADNNEAEAFGCLSDQERTTLESLLKRLINTHHLKSVAID